MSAPEAAVVYGDDDPEDDCPLCLEPLPPFWKRSGRLIQTCCGHEMCKDCYDKRNDIVQRAIAEGSFGREEKQLNRFCPMCRAELPEDDIAAKAMEQKFNSGQLPLRRYNDLGRCYLKGSGGVDKNVAKGVDALMLGAEKGDPCCQYALGDGYHSGSDGLPKSSEEAKRWYLAAAEQGHAVAEFALAIMFKEEGNDPEFLRRLRSSASKGFDGACYYLGFSIYRGQHGLQNSKEEAIHVLTPVAERGHAESMSLLGRILLFDPDSAHQIQDLLRRLGLESREGDGIMVPPHSNPNFTNGMHWLRRAAEKGDQGAMKSLKEVESAWSETCFTCHKASHGHKAFLRCSRCRAAWYCSKDCQVQHWKAEEGGHKHFCIKWE